MPSFSHESQTQLATLDSRLAAILVVAIKHFDFKVLEGHRSEERQNAAFEAGKSKLRYPQSKHNTFPSKAVDIAPYPIDWNDHERFTYLAGFLMAIAKVNGIPLRWGGDWDRDTEVPDETFRDIGHFELDE